MANPYDKDSPEWQLLEQYNSADALTRAADDDLKRVTERRSDAVKRRELYGAALGKLGHKFVHDKTSRQLKT